MTEKTELKGLPLLKEGFYQIGFRKKDILYPLVPAALTAIFLATNGLSVVPTPDAERRTKCIVNSIPNIHTRSDLSYEISDTANGATVQFLPRQINISEEQIQNCIANAEASDKHNTKLLTGIFVMLASAGGSFAAIGHAHIRNRKTKPSTPKPA